MKFFENTHTNSISSMAVIDDKKLITGHDDGTIKLWDVQENQNTYSFVCTQIFQGHTQRVHYLKKLSPTQFASVSKDSTLRIWDIHSSHSSKILQGGAVMPSLCHSMTMLPNNLLAVSGNCSPAWECFDVFDMLTGNCIHREQHQLHRPHGFSVGTAKGFLVAQGFCSGKLTLWEVTHHKCTQLDSIDDQRIYSMVTTKIGDVITGGFNLNTFFVSSEGKLSVFKSLENSNVIDDILEIDDYKILTIDRQNHDAGTLKIWDYLTGHCEIIGNSITANNKTSTYQQILPNSATLLSIESERICIQEFKEFLNYSIERLEIRKNSRLFAQSLRTQTGFFWQLPKEINIEIARLTASSLNKEAVAKVFDDHFCKPNSRSR